MISLMKISKMSQGQVLIRLGVPSSRSDPVEEVSTEVGAQGGLIAGRSTGGEQDGSGDEGGASSMQGGGGGGTSLPPQPPCDHTPPPCNPLWPLAAPYNPM